MQIITLLLAELSTETIFEGNFDYCESFNTEMAQLNLRPLCSDVIFEKTQETLIEDNDEYNDFVILNKKEQSKTTKVVKCSRILTTVKTTWHFFKPLSIRYENKNLSSNKEECDDIKAGFCDTGADPMQKILKPMTCYGSVCSTNNKPKIGFHYLKDYSDWSINCFLELLDLEYSEKTKENLNKPNHVACISSIICTQNLTCSCYSEEIFYEWYNEIKPEVNENFIPIQILRDIRVKDNSLFNKVNMRIISIVNKSKETLTTILKYNLTKESLKCKLFVI